MSYRSLVLTLTHSKRNMKFCSKYTYYTSQNVIFLRVRLQRGISTVPETRNGFISSVHVQSMHLQYAKTFSLVLNDTVKQHLSLWQMTII